MTSKLLMQFHSLLSTGFISSSCSRGVYAIESCRSLTNITEVVHVISLLPLFLFYNFVYLFIYYSFWLCGVFITAQAFFSLRQAGTPFQLWCLGFSLEGLLLPQSRGSRAFSLQKLWLPGSGAQTQGLGRPGPAALLHVGPPHIREGTRVSWNGRWFLYPQKTREALLASSSPPYLTLLHLIHARGACSQAAWNPNVGTFCIGRQREIKISIVSL